MTTNQTIDGVSRKAIEQALIAMRRIYQAGYCRIIEAGGACDTPEYMMAGDPTARELRALLDSAPDEVMCRGSMQLGTGCGECRRCKPAAQPQGEPVAYMAKRKNPTGNARLDRPLLSLVGPDGWGPAFECIPLYAEQPAPVAVVLPFADKVASKLRRFVECADDGQGADIGRHWFDVLTHLGLLNRVQRSPALWELTQQGEGCLEVARLNTPQ